MTAVECSHGMPSPGTCVDCMDEVGLGPSTTTKSDVDGHHQAVRDAELLRYGWTA